MNNQLEHGYDEFEGCDHQNSSSEKWFLRIMAISAVVLMVLFVITSIQHLWFTQVLINGMAG